MRVSRLALCCLMLCIVAVWGWTFALVKDAIAAYGVASFLAVRFAIAAIVMGAISGRRATRRSLKVGGLIGIVLAVSYLFQTYGLSGTTATNTGLITGLFVVFAPLAGLAFFGVRTPAALWVAIGVSVAGLALLTGAAPAGLVLGDVLALCCAACFGLHVALLGRYAKGHDAGVLALGQIGAAAVVFLVLRLALWPSLGPITWPTPQVWFALLVTGLIASAAAFYVQTFVQQRLSVAETAVIIVMEPLFAMIFGYLLAGDRLTWVQIIGAVLMVNAFFVGEIYPLIRKKRRKDHPPAAD